jgi:hypothetical protein
MRMSKTAVATALVLCSACRERPVSTPARVDLGGDVARVGDTPIPAALLAAVARSRPATAEDALGGIVEDALLAREARSAGLDQQPALAWAFTTTVARRVPELLGEEARSSGPPVDAELAALRVAHALVSRGPALSAARALSTAALLARAAAASRDEDDFVARASQVPHPGFQIVVERLPAFDASGRTADGQEFDPGFVAASFALQSPGKVSEPVETPFGWHIIRLTERTIPSGDELERRRTDLATAVIGLRVRTRMTTILRAARRRAPVDISVAADELMSEAEASPR